MNNKVIKHCCYLGMLYWNVGSILIGLGVGKIGQTALSPRLTNIEIAQEFHS